MVTICTTSLTFSNSTFCPHSVFMCFVWIWEQTAIISLYSINLLVCIIETECVYFSVRTGYLNIVKLNATLSNVDEHTGTFSWKCRRILAHFSYQKSADWLTNWITNKFIFLQLVNDFLALYGTRRFITVLTRARFFLRQRRELTGMSHEGWIILASD